MVPSASTADNIIFIVAPTETTSKYIEDAFNLSAVADIIPPSTVTVAPKASKPFIC